MGNVGVDCHRLLPCLTNGAVKCLLTRFLLLILLGTIDNMGIAACRNRAPDRTLIVQTFFVILTAYSAHLHGSTLSSLDLAYLLLWYASSTDGRDALRCNVRKVMTVSSATW